MDQLEFQAHWKRRRGQVRLRWDKLSDNDVDRVGGRYTHFTRLLQRKYAFTPAQAAEEIDQWLQKSPANDPRRGVPGP